MDDRARESIADAVGGKWTDLAIYLGFDWRDCAAIITTAINDQVKSQALYMLEAWSLRQGGSHLYDLKVALKAIRRYDLLKVIGMEVLDNECLENLAKSLGESWPRLAVYLGFDHDELIESGLAMLKVWKQKYYGEDSVACLTGALKEIRRYDLLRELGAEDLDIEILNEIGASLGKSWQNLACYLGLDETLVRQIRVKAGLAEQAKLMLKIWLEHFEGDNPVQYLVTALTLAGQRKLTQLFASQEMSSDNGRKEQSDFESSFECDPGRRWRPHCQAPRPQFTPSSSRTNTRTVVRQASENVKTEAPQEVSLNDGKKEQSDLESSLGKDSVKKLVSYFEKNIDPAPRPQFTPSSSRTNTRTAVRQASENVKTAAPRPQFTPASSSTKTSLAFLQASENVEAAVEETQEMSSDDDREEQSDLESSYGNYHREIPVSSAVATPLCQERHTTPVRVTSSPKKKTGFFQKCKTLVTKALSSLKKTVTGVGRTAKTLKNVTEHMDVPEGVTDTLETIGDVCPYVKTGLVIVIDGIACVWNIKELWEQRQEGKISLREFLKAAAIKASQALIKSGCAVGFGLAGTALGGLAGNFVIPALGSVVGGFLGGFCGTKLGKFLSEALTPFVDKVFGKLATFAVAFDNRSVTDVRVLRPADQVILPGTSELPERHAIVVDVSCESRQMDVICHTDGWVRKERVIFRVPIKRVEYSSKECRPQDEVLGRARSKIGELPQKCRDGAEFARWCKLRAVRSLAIT